MALVTNRAGLIVKRRRRRSAMSENWVWVDVMVVWHVCLQVGNYWFPLLQIFVECSVSINIISAWGLSPSQMYLHALNGMFPIRVTSWGMKNILLCRCSPPAWYLTLTTASLTLNGCLSGYATLPLVPSRDKSWWYRFVPTCVSGAAMLMGSSLHTLRCVQSVFCIVTRWIGLTLEWPKCLWSHAVCPLKILPLFVLVCECVGYLEPESWSGCQCSPRVLTETEQTVVPFYSFLLSVLTYFVMTYGDGSSAYMYIVCWSRWLHCGHLGTWDYARTLVVHILWYVVTQCLELWVYLIMSYGLTQVHAPKVTQVHAPVWLISGIQPPTFFIYSTHVSPLWLEFLYACTCTVHEITCA